MPVHDTVRLGDCGKSPLGIIRVALNDLRGETQR
jgi:hypothetical protein